MKRLLAVLLMVGVLLSFCACAFVQGGEEKPQTTTQEPPPYTGNTLSELGVIGNGTSVGNTEEYEKGDDWLTPEKVSQIPIANAEMTSQELRQICVDYLKLSVSCQWVADASFYLLEEDNAERIFTEGKLYGGLPYTNMASGNLYRFLEYMDPETGILDCSGLRATPDLFSSACSGTVSWAWARVITSAELSWTHSVNASHGYVPIGPYQYDFDMDRIWRGGEDGKRIYYYDTKKICAENGEQVMFESYALAHLADCFSRTGHVSMAVSEPVVVRNEDGTINGKESYVMIGEQGQFTQAKFHNRVTSDGVAYKIRGNDGRKYSFNTLYKRGYLIHTFKEFLGEAPIEEGKVTIPHTGDVVRAKDLTTGYLEANYTISDIFTAVYNANGEKIFKHVERTTNHYTKALVMSECIPTKQLEEYAGEGNTIQITAQLANGELVNVYEGELIS